MLSSREIILFLKFLRKRFRMNSPPKYVCVCVHVYLTLKMYILNCIKRYMTSFFSRINSCIYLLIRKYLLRVCYMPDPWGYNTEQNWRVPTHSRVYIPSKRTRGVVWVGDKAWKKMQGTAGPRGMRRGEWEGVGPNGLIFKVHIWVGPPGGDGS